MNISLAPTDSLQSLGIEFSAKGWFTSQIETERAIPIDTRLPGLPQLLDRRTFVHGLESHLLSFNPTLRIRACEVAYVRYRPMKYCQVYYSVALANTGSGHARRFLIAAKVVNREKSKQTQNAEAATVGAQNPSLPSLTSFPHDARIAHLRNFLNPGLLAQQLDGAQIGCGLEKDPSTTSPRWATVLSYRPGRYCLIKFDAVDDKGCRRAVVARINHSRAQAQHIWECGHRLWAAHLEDPNVPALVTEPLAFDSKHAISFYAAMPAPPLTRYLRTPQCAHHLLVAGRSIALVHAQDPAGLPRKTVEDTCQALTKDLRYLRRVETSLQPLVKELSTRLEQTMPIQGLPVFLHGDISTNQILCTTQGPRLIDFSGVCGDREFDVATFISRLGRQLFGSDLSAARASFLNAYQAQTAINFDPRRLAWYEAVSLIREALVPMKTLRQHWRDTLAKRLHQAHRVLTEA